VGLLPGLTAFRGPHDKLLKEEVQEVIHGPVEIIVLCRLEPLGDVVAGVPPVAKFQMTTGFPVSSLTPATYLIVGLARVDLADHRRFSFAYLFGASVLMTLAGVAFGVLPV
jgi:hypothetical protein